MRTNTKTTTTDASAEDRQRVQGIKDDDGGRSVLITGPVDWQRHQSVDFPYFQVAISNTVSSLSRNTRLVQEIGDNGGGGGG